MKESMQNFALPKNERGMPRVESLERAREILNRWNSDTKMKYKMAQNIVNEMLLQYPELKEVNGYEAYQADQKGLAEIAGNAANALSPENLAKVFQKPEQDPDPVVIPPPVVAQAPILKVEPTEPAEAIEPSAVAATPAPAKKSFVGSLVAEPTPEPMQPPQVSRAQEIAKKIKEHPFKMTAEDWAFKNDPKNKAALDAALMEGVTPVAPIDEANLISPGKTLDGTRQAFVEAKFNQSKNPSVDGEERMKGLEREYIEQQMIAHGEVKKTDGMRASMNFTRDEWAKTEAEESKLKNEELLKKLGKGAEVAGTVVGATAGLAMVAGAGAYGLAKFGYDRGTKAYQNVDWNKTYDKLKAKFNEKPKTWKETGMNWLGMETEEQKKKREEEEKKAEKEKLEQGKQKYKEFSKVNPENAVVKNKLEVDAVKKKNNFIEATFGGPVAPFGVGMGDENLKHWKTMEKIPVRRFMDPEGSGWNVKGVQITLKDYQKPGLAMREKLLPIFKQMEPFGVDLSKMTLNDFLMKAAEKGLLDQQA